MAGHSDDVFHHVRDATSLEFPGGVVWHIPQPLGDYFPITKFMLLEVVACLIVFWIYGTLARKIARGEPVRGRFWNFWEALALFVRDEIVRPSIGRGHHPDGHHDDHGQAEAGHGHGAHVGGAPEHAPAHAAHAGPHGAVARADSPWQSSHPADQHLPFVWSIFFFVLICNLIGALPWFGTPTGSLWATGGIALCALAYTIVAGSREQGVAGFFKSLVPNMDVPPVIKIFLVPMMWVIEFIGLLLKHSVLAVRLFANIMGGHTVIAVMLGFIGAVANSWLFYLVAPASVLGQVAISMLELFVAFLQAYIIAFLATLFIGSAVHPH